MKHAATTTHKLPFALMLLCSCALMCLCSSSSVRAGTLPNTAKLVPPETILLVDVDDFDRLRTQFEGTNFYKLSKDPAMAAFIDDFKTKWREKIRKPDNELLRVIADIDTFPRGRVAVAFVLNEQINKDANEPPLLLITQWGQTIAKIKEAVDKTVEKAVEDGAHRQSEDYRGVSITTIIRRSSANLSYCFIDDCLIGSMDLDVLKFVIAHIKGADSATLADDADYTAAMKAAELSTQTKIDLYVNIKQIVKIIAAEDDTGKTKTTINNLGLDNVISFGCSIGPGPSTAGSNTSFGKAFLKVRGEKKGICKMLDMESATLRVPQFIQPSAYSVSFVNLNIKKAYNELGNILNSISPQLAAMMYMPLLPPSPQGEPPLQLKADIVDHLSSQIIIAQSIREPLSDISEPRQKKSLIAVAIENRSALEKSLSLLHGTLLAANNPDARRQLLGYTIYLIDTAAIFPASPMRPKRPMQIPGRGTPQSGNRPETPTMPKLAFTVTDTHLIFAGESAVEQVIRALNSTENLSVSSAQWFNKAKSTIPSVVGLASLQNDAASGEFFWSDLRELKKETSKSKDTDSSTKIGLGVSSGSPFPQLILSQAGSDLFDFSLLPEFDVVRKYFGLSAFYGLSRPDGFFFEFKYINPRLDN
ncbi:MAG TPA: DUF3352 domain-containing protein [Sedimentisphaerales bacterium]|nr:DUF3352 domain-containing protein [Sedimentisphaerales bacterium]